MTELLVIPVILLIVGLVLRSEYSDWASRLARWMVIRAARFHPERTRMSQEWLAELDAIRRNPTEAQGLTFAGSIFVRYALSALVKVLDPTDVGIVLPWAILWSRYGRLYLIPLNVLVVTLIGLLFERRRFRKLGPGETLIRRGVVEPAKSKAHFYRSFACQAMWLVYTFWYAANYGSTSTYVLVLGWATWVGLMTFSPTFGRRVNEWAQRRHRLIDPRDSSGEVGR
jgi:hypothetical protein